MVNLIFKVLIYIGKKLNDNGITWGVGASILLNQFGFIEKPNDIDIFISIKDIERADEVLKSMGEKKKWESSTTYSTKYFYEYIIDGVDIDVMAGFAVNHNSGVFKYNFNHTSISEFRKINKVDIPFTSLEDWYVIYQLIPSRESKVKMIENYFLSNGIKNPILLKNSLKGNLPIEIQERVKKILGS
ncbi:nucleotidyltransferase family protein [Clostridium botulinum D/C]|uniref:nucleotidyltransferase n=1 Tax=Clostridium botulinum TaxID=1491 RepID=UPI001E3DDA38|nr:nucleotidyltransferase family protein [Clostridium botulinum D/C]MCD3361010.1 nucleotidyltransferase family protein [Clostridium botulinum D/C]MCD3363816.1 nucleotidyltransferase family protein [Clostridium botulinum D/C]MCD3366751.1 nucleotidyltransferase family protein [Clostridium botulinum D/C]